MERGPKPTVKEKPAKSGPKKRVSMELPDERNDTGGKTGTSYLTLSDSGGSAERGKQVQTMKQVAATSAQKKGNHNVSSDCMIGGQESDTSIESRATQLQRSLSRRGIGKHRKPERNYDTAQKGRRGSSSSNSDPQRSYSSGSSSSNSAECDPQRQKKSHSG